jgi:putative endonuclease
MRSVASEERRFRRVSKDRRVQECPRELGFTYSDVLTGSYYIGTTRSPLDIRVAQHNAGTFEGYTASRRPVELIFSQWFDQITDAIENERKLKKRSRAKKEALIRGDFASLRQLTKRKSSHPSRRPPEFIIGPLFARTRWTGSSG